MTRLLILSLCLLGSALALPRVHRPWLRKGHGRIVNGTAVSISDFPWQASLQSFGSQICGASIISSNWALTAAHCLDGENAMWLSVRAGTSFFESGGTVLQVSAAIMNDQFDSWSGDYDGGVVQVSEPFPLGSDVQIVQLASDGYDPAAGLAVTVTGWGDTETGEIPQQLLKADINIVQREICRTYFEELDLGPVTDTMVCAGLPDKGVCQGDSGSPLVSGDMQVGIVSWGNPTCVAPFAMYGNVGSMRQWIRETTGV